MNEHDKHRISAKAPKCTLPSPATYDVKDLHKKTSSIPREVPNIKYNVEK